MEGFKKRNKVRQDYCVLSGVCHFLVQNSVKTLRAVRRARRSLGMDPIIEQVMGSGSSAINANPVRRISPPPRLMPVIDKK